MNVQELENIIRPLVEKVVKQDWKSAKLDFLCEDSFSEYGLYITNSNGEVFEASSNEYTLGVDEMNVLNSFIKENCSENRCNKIIITLTPDSFSYEVVFIQEKYELSESMKSSIEKDDENTLKTTVNKCKLESGRYRMIENYPAISNRIKSLPIEPLVTSEFYTRLYSLFGKPGYIDFEGFTYIILDTVENKTFEASLTAFGAGYFSEDDSEATQKMIEHFHNMLYSEELKLKECKIKFGSDYGKIILGFSKGKFFYKEGNSKLE